MLAYVYKTYKFCFQHNSGVKAESPDEDSCDSVIKEDSHDEDCQDKMESSGSRAKFRDILPPGEQESAPDRKSVV
jgi:hypothetical protein